MNLKDKRLWIGILFLVIIVIICFYNSESKFMNDKKYCEVDEDCNTCGCGGCYIGCYNKYHKSAIVSCSAICVRTEMTCRCENNQCVLDYLDINTTCQDICNQWSNPNSYNCTIDSRYTNFSAIWNELNCSSRLSCKCIDSKTEEVEEPETLPIIYNIGIDLEPWNSETNTAGDVSFDVLQYDNKIFIEFGADTGDGSLNVHPMFVLPSGTEIHSVSNGIVYWVETLDDNDYDVCIIRYEGDPWCISYEHVTNPRVKEGDSVKIRDVIGEAGLINEFTESRKFDLKVWKGGQIIIDYCPYELLDESVRVEKQAEISQFIKDWEKYIQKDVYNEEEWISPGCAYKQLTE
ncbi:MAG: M23 family metallopeptidase [Candidatus Woesearchaeota archaeon]|nr:MAG: M23 family metallopeptidase [Candidatus Woesearchaeota archaeon]